jgi:hypothetical protein
MLDNSSADISYDDVSKNDGLTYVNPQGSTSELEGSALWFFGGVGTLTAASSAPFRTKPDKVDARRAAIFRSRGISRGWLYKH